MLENSLVLIAVPALATHPSVGWLDIAGPIVGIIIVSSVVVWAFNKVLP